MLEPAVQFRKPSLALGMLHQVLEKQLSSHHEPVHAASYLQWALVLISYTTAHLYDSIVISANSSKDVLLLMKPT